MANTETRKTQSRTVTTSEAIAEKGLMIAIDPATGLAEKATDKAGIRVIGVNKDICASGGTLEVYSGIFLMDNDSTHPIDQSYIQSHANVFVKDEHTIAHQTSNSLVAGDVIDVVAAGVWMLVGHDSGT